ncbi:MAG: secondary thiamine-phosphate synthase enzyme YjbQ [Bacillota bacterium]|jgi:secondary thiamine-phosphate synthase enzyme
MKFLTEYLWFNTRQKREYLNITPELQRILKKSGIQEGIMLVAAMHITAGIYINDDESGIIGDIDEMLERLAPSGRDYRHHRTGEDNGDAHLKNILVGHQVIVPITDGKLDFGPWQQVYYAEFDGQRRKRVVVKVMGE